MSDPLPAVSVTEKLAERIAAVDPARLPSATRTKCEDLAVDVIGLCLTVRNADYVQATLAACDDDGPCTVIGHTRTLSAAGAALVNGTAIHGEDFDDTFEGGPVHAGAVIVPAVLAACERHRPDGAALLRGVAVGIAGSMAAGIIEYLAEGAWTKRMHAGWAAQSGLRAALLAKHGFLGPRTVFEGTHGLFHGFAHTTKGA